MRPILFFSLALYTGLASAQFITHSQPVYSISISPDGKKVTTTGEEKTMKFWDTRSGKLLKSLAADKVHTHLYTPDEDKMIYMARYGKCRVAKIANDTIVVGGVFDREGIVDFYVDEQHYIKNQLSRGDKPVASIGIVNKKDPSVFVWKYTEKRKPGEHKFEYGGQDDQGRFLIRSKDTYMLFSKDTPADDPIAKFKLKLPSTGRIHLDKTGTFFIQDGGNAKVSLPDGEIIWSNPPALKWSQYWKHIELSSTGDSLIAYDGKSNLYILNTKTQKMVNQIQINKIEAGQINVYDIDVPHNLMAYSANNSGDVHLINLKEQKQYHTLDNRRVVNAETFDLKKELEENRQAYIRDVEGYEGYTHFSDNSGLSFYYNFGGKDTTTIFILMKNHLPKKIQCDFTLTFYSKDKDPYTASRFVKLKEGQVLEAWDKLIYKAGFTRENLLKIIIKDITIKYW